VIIIVAYTQSRTWTFHHLSTHSKLQQVKTINDCKQARINKLNWPKLHEYNFLPTKILVFQMSDVKMRRQTS